MGRWSRRWGGFTLIETALATVIVGVGVVAMMQLLTVCSSQNSGASQSTTAIYLAQCVQEMMADLPFNDPSGAGFGREESGGLLTWDDVDDFNGWDTTAGAPVDATRQPLTNLNCYAQAVTVQEVSPNNLTLALPGSDCKLVTVRILYRRTTAGVWTEIYRSTWLRTR